jgi:hypothetical protein
VKSSTQHWGVGQAKPERPKEAYEAALREAGKPRSPSIFKDLATRVNTRGCTDPAFAKFKRCVRKWFPN